MKGAKPDKEKDLPLFGAKLRGFFCFLLERAHSLLFILLSPSESRGRGESPQRKTAAHLLRRYSRNREAGRWLGYGRGKERRNLFFTFSPCQ